MYQKDPCLSVDRSPHSPHNIIPALIKKKAVVLDVGCNTGFLGKRLRKRGNLTDGVDINKASLAEARKYYRRVYVKDLSKEKLGLNKNLYDYIIFSDILEREESGEFILEKLPFMADSKNAFIFLEGKLNKPVLDAFRKSRAEINVFEIPKERKERFNTFLFANDFGSRDKLNLWIHFRQALQAEVSLEEMTGVLFWKMKDIVVKKSFGKFSEAELKNFLSQISTLLPKSRGEGKDAEAALEQFLLEAF